MNPVGSSIAVSYFDSSALVKRYFVETGSAWVQASCADPGQMIVLAEIGLVEIAAVLNGKLRGRLYFSQPIPRSSVSTLLPI